MIYNPPPYCKYSQGQIGWSDYDRDGLPDVIDTFPETTLTPYLPDPSPANSITYTGSASVAPLKNHNPNGARHDIAINNISEVEYRINYGSWNSATPVDSAFDESIEDFTFTTPILPNGVYLVETRATNNYGNVEKSYGYDYVTIMAAPSTAVPTPTGTWHTPTTLPTRTSTPYFTNYTGTKTPTPPGGSTFTPTNTGTPTITPTSAVAVQTFPFCDSFEFGMGNWNL